jgi:hypothetical protein
LPCVFILAHGKPIVCRAFFCERGKHFFVVER